MSNLTIRDATPADRPALYDFLISRWGEVVTRGQLLRPAGLPSLLAEGEGGTGRVPYFPCEQPGQP